MKDLLTSETDGRTGPSENIFFSKSLLTNSLRNVVAFNYRNVYELIDQNHSVLIRSCLRFSENLLDEGISHVTKGTTAAETEFCVHGTLTSFRIRVATWRCPTTECTATQMKMRRRERLSSCPSEREDGKIFTQVTRVWDGRSMHE